MLPKYLTQDELHRFFAVIPSSRDRALFALIYYYGFRVNEATMLTPDDIDLKNHRLKVRRLKNGLGGEKPLVAAHCKASAGFPPCPSRRRCRPSAVAAVLQTRDRRSSGRLARRLDHRVCQQE